MHWGGGGGVMMGDCCLDQRRLCRRIRSMKFRDACVERNWKDDVTRRTAWQSQPLGLGLNAFTW